MLFYEVVNTVHGPYNQLPAQTVLLREESGSESQREVLSQGNASEELLE